MNMSLSHIDALLGKKPFGFSQKKKEEMFLPLIRMMTQWHYENSPEFRKLSMAYDFNPGSDFSLEDLPFIPSALFKEVDLLSVPRSAIIKTLFSSSTSGKPSKIMIDQITANHQARALTQILADFLGKKRRHFLIFDSEETIQGTSGELSSRGTAIRGMMPLAKKMTFLLNRDLKLDRSRLDAAFSGMSPDEECCYFGFTWLLYVVYEALQDGDPAPLELLRKMPRSESLVLHIGGWKKLQERHIDKRKFNEALASILSLPGERIIDMYGMTEQLGTVYPDCPKGHKHAPLYSEVIIRNIDTLKPAARGESGLLQLVSPLPYSYPGISVLSDDLCHIVGTDDCPCGRKGNYFVFEKRSDKAELRGCGDTLQIVL